MQIDIRYIQANCLFQQKQYDSAAKIMNRYLQLIDKYEKGKLDLQILKTGSLIYSNQKEFIQSLQEKCYIELNKTKEM